MKYRVEFTDRADRSLASLTHYLSGRFSPENARRYQKAVAAFCGSLNTFPERGTALPAIGSGVRSIGFRHEITVLFRVHQDQGVVTVLDLFYRGRTIRL